MWKIIQNKNWNELQKFSWVSDMAGVPQNPVHHAEGDVEIHTRMVLQALEQLEEFKALEVQDQEILWASALLHDVEKRSCTRLDEDGNIVSPGHAKKGAQTARQILYREIETPFSIREGIVALIRYHGLPLWIFEKENPVQYLLKASLEVDTHLLSILAKADVLGRVCDDQAELLYRIDMFLELCKEQDCLGTAKQFPSDSAKFHYFRKNGQSADYKPFDDMKSAVVILSGIAGSGKDHFIQRNFRDLEVISLDDMRRKLKIDHKDARGNGRIIQEAKKKAKELMRKNENFIWNATNITEQMRSQLVDLFAVYNPVIQIIYLEVPYKKLLSQNRNRNFPIPEAAIEKMIDKLEVPKTWEAHQVKWIAED